MKTINNNHFFKITTLLLAIALASVFFMGMKADTSPNTPLGYSASDVSITVEKPKGWLTKETSVKIIVESDLKLSALGKDYADISIQAVDKASNKSAIVTVEKS